MEPIQYFARRWLLVRCCAAALAGTWCTTAFALDAPLEAAGLRQVQGRHVTLVTDLAPNEEIDSLPGYFDQAFPQWCAYFGIDPDKHADWHVTACLMRARERFETAGLLPRDQKINTGFARPDRFWLFDQTSVYYRRHLFLHEGTHAFMWTALGDVGTPWFAEGLAELLATHHLEDGKLTLNYLPQSTGDVPQLGRIELVQKAFADRKAMTLSKVFDFRPGVFLENEYYAWSWAAAAFLDRHPATRERFHQLPHSVRDPNFRQLVVETFAKNRETLNEDWQLYVANLDYGYDFERMAVNYASGQPLPKTGAQATVAADRGWQSSGFRLEAGRKYRLRASGRYQVAQQPRPWDCEPGGVTIRYYHGQPLGILLAALRSDEAQHAGSTGLVRPIVVGLEQSISVPKPATLYLRINDSAGSLADNAGSLSVEITPE